MYLIFSLLTREHNGLKAATQARLVQTTLSIKIECDELWKRLYVFYINFAGKFHFMV
jgi:hypothetical protein